MSSNAVALAAAILGFLTVVIGLLNQQKIKKTAAIAGQTSEKVQKISVDVDGRLSDLIERQAQLLGALHESGTPIPPRQTPAASPPGAALTEGEP